MRYVEKIFAGMSGNCKNISNKGNAKERDGEEK